MGEKIYPYVQITSKNDLPEPQEGTGLVGHYAFEYIDFTEVADYALGHTFVDCIFFGCDMMPGQDCLMRDCLVFPKMGRRYHAFAPDVYTPETLYEGYVPGDPDSFNKTFDAQVAAEYFEQGEDCADIKIMLARTLHDHSMNDAMLDFLRRYRYEDVIGIMGGHGIKRSDEGYAKIVMISKALTEAGKLMISGGGPGAMEATHLGAWMAGRTREEAEDAISILAEAGEDDPVKWLDSAFEVRRWYPQKKYCSLSIPTWHYGQEPSTPLATHISKFFTNSVREDMILSIALGGVIFTPGSAGTVQEVFQNAAKLHYDEDGGVGPMIFLGTDFFSREIPVYPFLKDLVDRKKYSNIRLYLTDNPDEVIEIVRGVKNSF